jgi:hypothetical protein
LTSLPVLQAPKSGVPFRLYIAAEPSVIGAVLTQETDGKEYVVAYESIRLLDAETRYTFIEKLCLSLYYVCTKLRHYLLTSTCYVACQTDIIKYMLQKPILSGRVDKWAYALRMAVLPTGKGTHGYPTLLGKGKAIEFYPRVRVRV